MAIMKTMCETSLMGLLMLPLYIASASPAIEDGFQNPPNSAKPHTWYHMMNGNVTKEGITCDFEAIANAGIGGVQMFDAGCSIPPGPLAFDSPEWFDMLKHAASEARRLGLEICIPNCSGWSSSGGPWNMPSNGMKKVVFTETAAKGPSQFAAKLPRTKDDHGFYEDIAVLAFPTPPADLAEFGDVDVVVSGKVATISAPSPFTASGFSFRLSHPWAWIASAEVSVETSMDGVAFEELENFTLPLADSGTSDFSLRFHSFARPVAARAIRISFSTKVSVKIEEVHPEVRCRISGIAAKTFAVRSDVSPDAVVATPDQLVCKEDVLNLTSMMTADGLLKWDVPDGDWTILRIAHVCSGKRNHPASEHGVGLEVDKLSAAAMDYHFSQYVARLCEYLGSLAGAVESGFNNILVDSYEVGSQNWTQGFENVFESRMGYSLLPYLPVFTGRVVGGVDESERFLEDFRRVVSDLFAENYAGRLAELCHQHGLMLSLEPYGNGPSDNLQYGQDVDIPMGEFWSAAAVGDHVIGAGNSRFASYLAHVWGRRYAAAEAFTAQPSNGGRWLTTPFSIKAKGDCAYCDGVNRIIYHRFVHQPWPGKKYIPGVTMGRWGMHLDRTQTWWEFARPWFRYQARCQWMLQEGEFVADALYFCGEQAPNQGGNTDGTNARGDNDMKLPNGYKWDVCATKALKKLRVVDGNVVAPSGVKYRLLVLPKLDTMSVEILCKVEALVDAGAKVCGLKKPIRAPGLRGFPNEDGRVRDLADKIWAKGVMTCCPLDALKRLGVEPDFASKEKDPEPSWIHRRGNGADWYFVALNNVKGHTFEVSVRMAGRQPEIWDAETGEIRDAEVWREEGGRTYVTLSFPPSGSAFVVFRRASTIKFAHASKRAKERSVAVEGDWRVVFPTEWYSGGTARKSVIWNTLMDWKDVDDDDIRYFSGTATYAKRLPKPEIKLGERLILDIGEVKNFAEVTVNGKIYEPLWRPPFMVDITDAIQENAEIDLSIRVANLWPNRLIGDDILYPDDCEWKGEAKNGVKEIGIKEIPKWVKEGNRSPTGRHTFTTWKHWDKNDKLLPSGLLGPVRLVVHAPIP